MYIQWHSCGPWIFGTEKLGANMSCLLAIFSRLLETWQKTDNFSIHFEQPNAEYKCCIFGVKNLEETSTIFRVFFEARIEVSLDSKQQEQRKFLCSLLFRPRKWSAFVVPKETGNGTFLARCLALRNEPCFPHVSPLNIAAKRYLVGPIFGRTGKIFPNRKTCLNLVFPAQKSIGQRCETRSIRRG